MSFPGTHTPLLVATIYGNLSNARFFRQLVPISKKKKKLHCKIWRKQRCLFSPVSRRYFVRVPLCVHCLFFSGFFLKRIDTTVKRIKKKRNILYPPFASPLHSSPSLVFVCYKDRRCSLSLSLLLFPSLFSLAFVGGSDGR